MREILFRGKRVDNGEWVFGYLGSPHSYSVVDGKITNITIYTFTAIDIKPNSSFFTTLVKADTVGFYTGVETLGEKPDVFENRTRIFEGDIVKAHYETSQNQTQYEKDFIITEDKDIYGKVVFLDGCFIVDWGHQMLVANQTYRQPVSKFIYSRGFETKSMLCEYTRTHEMTPIKVVGNIYDNPELVKIIEGSV